MTRRPTLRATACASLLAGLVACARPSPIRAPASEPPPAKLVEPIAAVPEAPLPLEDDEPEPAPAEPPRHGRSVAVIPPSPPQAEYEVWGDLTGTPIGEAYGHGGLGCPPGQRAPVTTRHGRRSLVQLRTVTGEGALAEALAVKILRGRAANLQACHLDAMQEDRALAGSLRLRLVIHAGGLVSDAVIVETEVGLESCVLAVARAWRFPPADADSKLDVVYDLSNRPAPPERPRCR